MFRRQDGCDSDEHMTAFGDLFLNIGPLWWWCGMRLLRLGGEGVDAQ